MKGHFELCVDNPADQADLIDQFETALEELLDVKLGGGSAERSDAADDCVRFDYTCQSDDPGQAVAEIGKLGFRYGFGPAALKRHEVPAE